MRFSMLLIGFFCAVLGMAGQAMRAEAAADLTSAELQGAIDLIFPSGSSFPNLEAYDLFSLTSKGAVSGGVSAVYEAGLSGAPWVIQELPQLKLLIYTYSTEVGAESAFENLKAASSFATGQKLILSSEHRNLFYQSPPSVSADLFGTIASEEYSLHIVHLNGNVLFQASLYREGGDYDQANVFAFSTAVSDLVASRDLLETVIEKSKIPLGLLFPPSSSDFSVKSESNSWNLESIYEVPLNGAVDLDLYLGEPASAVGTVLDSSGVLAPVPGDIYLYLQGSGHLLAGIFAPDYDSNCGKTGDWVRLQSSRPLYSYEWNHLSISYGVEGFSLLHEGDLVGECGLSQSFSGRDLFLGDFPDDDLAESFIGQVNDIYFTSHRTPGGETWDDFLTEHLFWDVSDSDPDYSAFAELKNRGIFLGSWGSLRPDAFLNRAEMVKTFLKTYGRELGENADADDVAGLPFWDVASNAWYRGYLAEAYAIGMVEGHSNGTFLPEHEINRAEFFTMLLRLSGERVTYEVDFSDVDARDWYAEGAAFAKKHGLMDGFSGGGETGLRPVFDPARWVTRREAARVLVQLLD